MDLVILSYYCLLILLASLAGGMAPVWLRFDHRRMQFAVSFVAGVMLGVGVLHMLPHAVEAALAAGDAPIMRASTNVMLWLLAGVLVMFFMERFLCFHHHDAPGEAGAPVEQVDHSGCGAPGGHHHVHDLSWGGAALGLALHSVLNGVALAASVEHGSDVGRLAGFGTFLVVFLHKPFDAMTIGMLMARGRTSLFRRQVVNMLFALAIPLGAVLFELGFRHSGTTSVAHALAFSAGTFLCISLSDLLPELQFHQHDRGKLSLALLAGLAIAYAASRLEAVGHHHAPPGASAAAQAAATVQ